jgi:hypothetical protein
MAKFKLTEEIVSLSVADKWEMAKTEWDLSSISFAEEFENCLCGHPIIELCEIINKKNQNVAIVGNCCVNKFMGLPSDLIFQAVKRIKKDIEKSLNGEAIELAYSKNWINSWEYEFYCDTSRKRNLSEKQMTTRIKINEKILSKIKKDNVII